MQNFENKISQVEKNFRKISGGIFDKNKVNLKLKEIEKHFSQNEQF